MSNQSTDPRRSLLDVLKRAPAAPTPIGPAPAEQSSIPRSKNPYPDGALAEQDSNGIENHVSDSSLAAFGRLLRRHG